MKWLAIAIAGACALSAFGESGKVLRHTLTFTSAQAAAVGPIEKLVVTVDCGRVETLRNLPELHGIQMGYETPAVNVLEARPRLGAAAVSLDRWSGVINVTGPESECFGVTVHAEGRKSELNLNTRKNKK